MKRERHPRAGKTVRIASKDAKYNGQLYRVEDYWENVYGESWMFAVGNPAALLYAVHGAVADLPIDNEVVYGKIGFLGYLFHESELGEVVEQDAL